MLGSVQNTAPLTFIAATGGGVALLPPLHSREWGGPPPPRPLFTVYLKLSSVKDPGMPGYIKLC